MKKLLAILLMLLPAVWMSGQGVVTGRVTDSLSGEPLPYATVSIDGTSRGTTTDIHGDYTLRVNTADSVVLQYSFVGYRKKEIRSAIRGRVTMDVAMHPVAKQLDGVEIVVDTLRGTSFTQIDVGRLDDAVGPTGGVESLVKMLPDVQSNNELSSQYSVRGGSFDENLVYINGVEVFRPMLIHSAQQEGMSIINPDLVNHIRFSPGGFDATYGDKLSSVLDISYSRPTEFKAKLSGSLLGAAASVLGTVGERFNYAVGLRQHSNRYVFGSLDTKGSYSSSYTDVQALLGYKVNERLDLEMLAIWTRNVYGLVPDSATVTFGGFFLPLSLHVFFDGQEQDSYHTLLGSLSANYRPDDQWRLNGNLSVQHVPESECYDVQSQYWLYELGMGETAGDTVMFDRGVGTFLEHARNRLSTDIISFDTRAVRDAQKGHWTAGLKLQMEKITDHLREWKWVDSAGYALPMTMPTMGDSANRPQSPILQQYASADNEMLTLRGTAFVQRDISLVTTKGNEIRLTGGLRGQLYRNSISGLHHLISPRLSASYVPHGKADLMFRLAAGIYQQAPFYREYRRENGSLCPSVGPQTSYQVTGTADWRLLIWQKPFTITADIYYKYITDLIPYTIDNLRLRYMPDLSAEGYATGVSIRINGELVEGLESWASFSIMQTQEDIEGDNLGWLARPTDQRLSFKFFLQDNIPSIPWWRMSLSMVYGTGTPVTMPMGKRAEESFRLPSYYRVDWGNSVQLKEFQFYKHSKLAQWFDDIQVGFEVFNLFNNNNVISYLWVSDYENRYYPVPNYLTARQLNFKLTLLF